MCFLLPFYAIWRIYGVFMAYLWRIYGVYASSKGSNFAPSKHLHTLNPLSLIGTGIAFKRYKDAKSEYDALLAKKAAIQSTVDTYNQDKYVFDIPDEKPVDQIPGLQISSRVLITKAALGKAIYVNPHIVLTNTGTETITIQAIFCDYSAFKQPLILVSKDGIPVTSFVGYQTRGMIVIEPEQTLEIDMPGGYSGWTEKIAQNMDKIIQGALTTDFTIMWNGGRASYNGIPGVLAINHTTRSIFK